MRAAAWIGRAAVGAAFASAACNGILDNHDRMLDDSFDASTPKDSGRDGTFGDDGTPPPAPPPPPPPTDANVPEDSGPPPITVSVSTTYATPNGAQFTIVDGGAEITGYTGTDYHAVLVPSPQPSVPSDDYTVIATVQAGQSGEFGVLTRVQNDSSCALLGSKFGGATEPFIATMGPPSWNPNMLANGASYNFVVGGRYEMKAAVTGTTMKGKMWLATDPEPDWQVTVPTLPWSTGRGIGWYVYLTYDAVLENLVVTVP